MAIGVMKRISPEYVLKNAIADIKEFGFDGLKPYLTSEALKKAENYLALSDGLDMFSAMGMAFMPQSNNGGSSSGSGGSIKEKMKECDYTIKDVMKGSSSAKGVVEFNYKDSTKGTVELSMIKEDKEWKIDNMSMPQIN
ncbi:MAG: DUF4878 domain-containing protein [Lachnospiraceae bacterium]|nr:DUF4878 domain-containing protein [Lachnospiraceae bacterium]